MLTPRGAVADLAETMGTSLRAVEYVVRLLREDGSNLWPEIGSGRRGALIGVPDLVNAALAIACSAGQPSTGPRLVKELRQLRPVGIMRYREGEGAPTREGSGWVPIPWGLGDLLDAYVASAVDPKTETIPELRAATARPSIRVRLTSPLTAEVTWPDTEGASYDRITYALPDATQASSVAAPGGKLFCADVEIGLPEIEALAGILRNNHASAPGRADAGNATPETTKAAGPGSHNGLHFDQPATRKLQTLDKSQFSVSQGRKQLAPDPNARELQVRRQPASKRNTRNGAHWTDAASP